MKEQQRPLFWIGSSKKDLKAMPEVIQDIFGYALHPAQKGRKHDQARPLKGFGGVGVLEVVEGRPGTCQRSIEMIDVEKGTGNVYADLERPDAAEMQVKARLATKIGEIIKHRHLTQTQAGEILGMPQPKLSGMLRGHFRGISEAKMLECLNRLGRDVEILIRKAPRTHATGRTSVVFV